MDGSQKRSSREHEVGGPMDMHDLGSTAPKAGPRPQGDALGVARVGNLLAQMLDSATDDCDAFEIMDALARGLADLVPAGEVGLLVFDDQHRLGVVASTDESAELMELYQLQSRSGPCIAAAQSGRRIALDLDAADARWPRVTAHAVALGFRSLLAIPLRLRGDVIGCVNVFSRGPALTDRGTVETVQAVVDTAGATLHARRRIDEATAVAGQLEQALRSRVAIEQAKGIVAEHAGIGVDQAFALLRAYARRHRLKLSVVATQVSTRAVAAAQVVGHP